MKLDQLLLVMLVGVMLMNTSNAVPDTCECANEVKTPEICTPTRRTDSASVTEFAVGVEKVIDEVIRKKHNVQHLDEKMNKTLDNGAKVTKKRFREFVARVLQDGPIIVDDEVLSNMEEKKAKINEASDKMAKGLGLITSNMDNFIKLVAKDTDGFERAEIATMLLSEIAGLLPSPVGQGAAALFGLISSVMSASKPSTDKIDPHLFGKQFWKLKRGSSKAGAAELGQPVKLNGDDDANNRHHLDMVVVASVACCANGVRLGKGLGYAEIEWGLLVQTGMVDDRTVVATTVHDCQVVSESELPLSTLAVHDLPVDIIVTPTRIINVRRRLAKPMQGILWELLSPERLNEMPVLRKFKREDVT